LLRSCQVSHQRTGSSTSLHSSAHSMSSFVCLRALQELLHEYDQVDATMPMPRCCSAATGNENVPCCAECQHTRYSRLAYAPCELPKEQAYACMFGHTFIPGELRCTATCSLCASSSFNSCTADDAALAAGACLLVGVAVGACRCRCCCRRGCLLGGGKG
jgi:hypothetical protein